MTRPGALNLLHKLHLASPGSQTIGKELATLARYATGTKNSLEIGTFQGVSAVHIVKAMSPDGILTCVDPWPEVNGRKNPCLLIAQRHFRRTGTSSRIKILRQYSAEAQPLIPRELDFAFIDGDHSWKGIETDWSIVAPRMARDGIVCLHDMVTPADEPWRVLDSMRFFKEIILRDPAFALLETVHSLAVLRKK